MYISSCMKDYTFRLYAHLDIKSSTYSDVSSGVRRLRGVKYICVASLTATTIRTLGRELAAAWRHADQVTTSTLAARWALLTLPPVHHIMLRLITHTQSILLPRLQL